MRLNPVLRKKIRISGSLSMNKIANREFRCASMFLPNFSDSHPSISIDGACSSDKGLFLTSFLTYTLETHSLSL